MMLYVIEFWNLCIYYIIDFEYIIVCGFKLLSAFLLCFPFWLLIFFLLQNFYLDFLF